MKPRGEKREGNSFKSVTCVGFRAMLQFHSYVSVAGSSHEEHRSSDLSFALNPAHPEFQVKCGDLRRDVGTGKRRKLLCALRSARIAVLKRPVIAVESRVGR